MIVIPAIDLRGGRAVRLLRGPLDHVVHRVAAFDRRGDVQEHELVGAVGVVARGELDRVAGVTQVLEPHAFDDAAGVDVEAGDDPLREHADVLSLG